jgi:hypothetical protein
LPVFKVGKAPPGTAEANTLENKDKTLLKPSSTGRQASGLSIETKPN